MNSFIIILCSLTCCGNCIFKTSEITCEKVTQVFPNLSSTGKLTGYDTSSVHIYYYKNLILYNLSYHFDSTVNDKLLLSEKRFHYILYEKGNSYGYDFDEHKTQYKRKISMDSVFKIEWIAVTRLYPLFVTNIAILLSSNRNKDSGTLHEQYLIKAKDDTTVLAKCSLGFTNKLQHVRYSLSKELDSIKKMKLNMVRIKNHTQYFKEYNFTLDTYELAYDLESVPVFNQNKIMSYFNMYKKEENAK
jgi:hypothetical protein